MVFFCQKNSFATKHESTVVSCAPAVVQVEVEESTSSKGKPSYKEVPCFEVTFEDTVFFPEGGGQPDDRGVVTPLDCPQCGPRSSPRCGTPPPQPPALCAPTDVIALLSGGADDAGSGLCPHGASVLRVLRRGPDAVHCLDRPVTVGEKVLQVIDWRRRKDHMQQHSAQHLLTAVADQLYGAATSSWSLGRHTSTLELHTRSLTEAQLEAIEARANDAIAAALPVSVTEYARPDELPDEVRSRGLPSDHVGGVRVVSIAGLDDNMCCGTHVTNTAQLQAVKIIGMEPGKTNKTLLSFVAGGRLLRYLSECHTTLRSLNPLLHTAPDDYVAAVSKLQRSLKLAEKCSKESLKDLAAAEARLLMQKVKTSRDAWQLTLQRKGSDNPEAVSPCHRKVMLVQLEEGDGHGVNSMDSNKENAESQGTPRNACSAEDCGHRSADVSTSGGVDCNVMPLLLVAHHRRLADMDYVNAIANNFTIKEGVVLLLTAGEDRGPGVLVLSGPMQLLRLLGPKLCEVLEGKGGGKTRFSARVSALHRRRAAADAALRLLTEHCDG